mgnify:CR=1 FL=1
MVYNDWTVLAAIAMVAIVIDWLVGDPRHLPHPVIGMGRWIQFLETRLYTEPNDDPRRLKRRGATLAALTILPVFLLGTWVVLIFNRIHPWAGFTVQAWLVSTTIAVKGLKDAAFAVYRPLCDGELELARRKTGEIVGRDTAHLDEAELTRATVETVAENTTDAFIAPLFFALLGGAPLALAYRAVNTLDSMVGYKNERYIHFGWASARLDDVLNWIPARLSGFLLSLACLGDRQLSMIRAWKAMIVFARRHPSPNSGYPESATAGALGIELGGTNQYGGKVSERPRLGWPLRGKTRDDIRRTAMLLYRVSYIVFGGLLCALLTEFIRN